MLRFRRSGRASAGFTLVELMITVAVLAVLVTIAYPAYQGQMLKARRTDAKVSLMNTAQALERCFTQYSAYNHSSCPTVPATSDEGYYTLAATTLTATTYTLTATPVSSDPDCGNFTLTHTGAEGASGSLGSATCW